MTDDFPHAIEDDRHREGTECALPQPPGEALHTGHPRTDRGPSSCSAILLVRTVQGSLIFLGRLVNRRGRSARLFGMFSFESCGRYDRSIREVTRRTAKAFWVRLAQLGDPARVGRTLVSKVAV